MIEPPLQMPHIRSLSHPSKISTALLSLSLRLDSLSLSLALALLRAPPSLPHAAPPSPPCGDGTSLYSGGARRHTPSSLRGGTWRRTLGWRGFWGAASRRLRAARCRPPAPAVARGPVPLLLRRRRAGPCPLPPAEARWRSSVPWLGGAASRRAPAVAGLGGAVPFTFSPPARCWRPHEAHGGGHHQIRRG